MKPRTIISAGVVALTLTACGDFLNVEPKNFISSTNFFETEEDFVQAINATYAPLRMVYDEAYVMGEMRSDNTHYIFNSSNRGNLVREEIADFVNRPTAEPASDKWTANYRIVAYANEVLSRIDEASLDDNIKGNLKGQALFLRAFAYFDLVQYFGGVPIILNPTSGSADDILNEYSAMPRNSTDEVYAQIIADAQEAAQLLPAKSAQEPGRATSGAARTLLGNVYIVLEQWAQAETELKHVVNSGEYSLMTDYAAIFSPENKNNQESIFEIQYMEGNLGLQSRFAYVFMPNLTNLMPIVGFQFNNQSTGGWNMPTEDLLNAYEPGDMRRAASIAEGYTDADGAFVALPYIKKYLHLPLPAPNGSSANTDENWPVYRYAEVLLFLAEALNEQQKPSEALTYLNQVRDRAFGAGVSPVSETGQDALRTLILHERRIELAFENKRWLDLVRTGQAVAVMNAYGAALKATGEHPYLLPQAYEVNENKLIFPIPFDEMQRNPNFEQNPGY